MRDIKKYNLFILISTFARNIATVFSAVLLYKKGYSLKEIFIFFSILYLTGAIVSYITIYLTNKIKIKYLLIFSSIVFGVSFYYMSTMDNNILNLFVLGIMYGVATYSYHTIRHYLAISSFKNNKRKNIGSIIIYTNVGIIISSLISGYIESTFSTIYLAVMVIIISLIGIIPILRFEVEDREKVIDEKIDGNKVLFFIFEQSKVLFLSLEPLYIFLFVDNSIKFVGIVSAIVGLSSCIFTYFFVRKVNDKEYFPYLNFLFCLTLLLKLNINNKYLMLFIVFIEGLGIKMYDIVSTENLYDIGENINIKGYLVKSEIIFCLVQCICYMVFIFVNNIKIILYILLVLIFISGFVKKRK